MAVLSKRKVLSASPSKPDAPTRLQFAISSSLDFGYYYQRMKRRRLSYFLIPFAFLAAAPALVAQGAAEPLSCADRSVTASAVHTPEDVKAFVQCAYEFVQEMGFEEAHRAFNEDER